MLRAEANERRTFTLSRQLSDLFVHSRLGPRMGTSSDRGLFRSRVNDVVPVPVKIVAFDLQCSKLLLRHCFSRWVVASVEARADHQATAVGGVADQVYHGFIRP